MAGLFTGPRLKVERADKHIIEIEARLRDFAALDANQIVTKVDSASGTKQIVFEGSESLSEHVNLAFGDAIHNLRSALDHLWVAFAIHFDPNADVKNLYFPLGENEQGLIARIDNGEEKHSVAIATQIGQKVRDILIKRIKAYGGWNSLIGMLGKMDNIDKHRLLLTVLTSRGATTGGGSMMIGTNTYTIGIMKEMRPDSVFIRTPQNVEIKGNLKAVIEVFINETEMAQPEPLIPTLRNLSQVVSQAIDAFEQCIVTHGATP
jgi:hypothetical protein